MKKLVVFYSRSGITKNVALQVAALIGAEVEQLHDMNKRSGIIGFLTGGRDAMQKKLTRIKPIKKEPHKYDLVVVGTPVWASNMAPAVRTFLHENILTKDVAFFCTAGGASVDNTLIEMRKAVPKGKVRAEMGISGKDIKIGCEQKVKDFCGKL